MRVRGSSPIVGVVGYGVTGSRVVGHLVAQQIPVAVHDLTRGPGVQRRGVVALGSLEDLTVCDLVVLSQPAPHAEVVRRLISHGTSVLSISDDLDDLRALLDLAPEVEHSDAAVVVGAGMAPGLSGLLARMLAAQLHVVDELHVATHGTAGPACARQHHQALGDTALGWHDHEWIEPPGGSGRDLVWFPEPIGARDCYRAAMADPVLMRRAFPHAGRITARMSATRRDRFTARLPMLTPPHASGDLGAVRVEARGAGPQGERITLIAGAAGHTGDLAAAVCAATALRMVVVDVPAGVHALGDDAMHPLDVLHHATSLGVRVQEFTGVARATSW